MRGRYVLLTFEGTKRILSGIGANQPKQYSHTSASAIAKKIVPYSLPTWQQMESK